MEVEVGAPDVLEGELLDDAVDELVGTTEVELGMIVVEPEPEPEPEGSAE